MSSNWGPGEPNNRGGHEDCAYLAIGYDYRMNDYRCNYSGMEFICERKGTSTILYM